MGALSNLISENEPIPSRLGPMYEEIGWQATFLMGEVPYRKGFNPNLARVEALQILSGTFDDRLFDKVANLVVPWTIDQAYGYKLALQLPKVLKQLIEAQSTRRAILHIGQPNDGYENEKPCIQTYQFLVRGGELNMVLFARSWDLVLGLPYDIAVAGIIGQVFAYLLNLNPGKISCFASSGHVYEKDVHLVKDKSSRYYIIHDIIQALANKEGANEYWDLGLTLDWSQICHWAIDILNKVSVEDKKEKWEYYLKIDLPISHFWSSNKLVTKRANYPISLVNGLAFLCDTQKAVSGLVPGALELSKENISVYGTALLSEVMEFINELGWKPWKNIERNHDKIVDEFADILAFLGLFVNYLDDIGLTPDKLTEAYTAKTKENIDRFNGKYLDKGYPKLQIKITSNKE